MRSSSTYTARLLIAVAVLSGCSDHSAPVAPEASNAAAAGRPSAALAAASASAERQLVLFRGSPARFEAQVASIGGEVVFHHPAGLAMVTGADEAALQGLASVTEAAPEPTFFLDEPAAVGEAQSAGIGVASHGDPTHASSYARQWNMRAIGAPEAWAAGRLGSPDVTVAILDTGIDYLYPDLVGRVDLSRSVSFVPADDALAGSLFPGRHPITDLDYHGTHVAATVASNAVGMAGVTRDVTLMGVKVCSVLGGCPGVVQGLLHAADNGADVINMSLSFTDPFIKRDAQGVTSFFNVLFAYLKMKDVTVVVAAGNEARDIQHVKNGFQAFCEAEHVICVAATGPASTESWRFGPWFDIDAPAFYTNYGRKAIDVAAPGGSAAGAVWAACSTSSLVYTYCQDNFFILSLIGTSMAAPHVAGLAALVVEDVGKNPARVVNAIRNGADVVPGNPPSSPFYGRGRINVAKTIGN